MPQIKKLSTDLINKIAAGEVVERPASIVKELVENSIDAQADQILLDIKNGGIDSIIIQDNGTGMTQEDALLAIEPHATSKITKLEDLFNIQTLGFRGEALASISAVSQFNLITKTKDTDEGTSLKIKNSQQSIEPCGCPVGTKILINDLFYNVPARKKFLKNSGTEYTNILETLTNFALIFPQISFRLSHNDKLIVNYPKTNDWLERIKQVVGQDIAKELIPVNTKGSIQISGFIGKPQISRNNRKAQFVFVNQRNINDFLIAKAVKDAYGTLIPKELYPTFILNIQLSPELVDVNVHPRKLEVKFKNSQEIFSSVIQAITNSLTGNISQQIRTNSNTPIKTFTIKSVPTNSEITRPTVHYQSSFKSVNTGPRQINQALDFSKQLLNAHLDLAPQAETIGEWRLLGQIHNAYLLIEAKQGILIVDQHAAAERIIYQKFIQDYNSNNAKSQKLLLPFTLNLSTKEVEILDQSQEILHNLGFEIDVFGNNSFIVNGVPQELDKLDVKTTILGLINDLEDENFNQAKSVEDKKDLVIKYAACRAAVKFQDKLELPEQIKLLEDIQINLDIINTCPHGRPFIMELTLDQLAKNFKRI